MVLDSLSIICELMNRHLLSVFLSVSLLVWDGVSPLEADEAPPNTVIIMVDDGKGEGATRSQNDMVLPPNRRDAVLFPLESGSL